MSIRGIGIGVCALIASALAGGVALEISRDLALMRSAHQIEESTRLRSLIGKATIELSVGRSLTQVALALPDPVSPELKSTLDAQRLKTAPLFEEIRTLAQGATALQNANDFVREFDSAIASLSSLRSQADAEMAKPLSQRDAEAVKAIPSRIKGLVRSTFDTGALLEPQNVSVSSAVMLGLATQRFGWEIREYGGRERTHFVIAAATREPIRANALSEMEIQADRAAHAWGEVEFLLRGAEMPPSVKDAAYAFKAQYLGPYAALRREMMAAAGTGAYPVDFKTFFNRSGEALATAVVLSSAGADFALKAADELKVGALRGLWIAIAAGLAGLVMLTFMTWFIMIRVSGRITGITNIMQRLAAGDLSVDAKPFSASDEIGRMAATVGVFRANAERVASAAGEKTEADARASVERKIELSRLADSFDQSVGGVVSAVSAASEELEAAAETMSAAAGMTREQAGTVTAASGEASANVSMVAAASEELAASTHEIGGRVQHSAAIAARASEETRATTQRILALADSAQRIGTIVDMISGIAGQTNLLALNATIEAARAGEAGRGFAVVASEVKLLADQTGKATAQIAEQIGAMQAETRHSADSIASINHTIAEMRQIADEIATSVEQQNCATQEIARNIAEASSSTAMVSSSIGAVNGAAVEAGDAARRVLNSAQGLTKQAVQLRREVGRFLTTVRN